MSWVNGSRHEQPAAHLSLVTDVTMEPISVARTKDRLRIDTTDDDDLVLEFIRAARRRCETFTGLALLTQTWKAFYDDFPGIEEVIYVPKPPLASVTHIKYLDTSDVQQTWGASNYKVSTVRTPGIIVPEYSQTWPTEVRDEIDAVEIQFVAGWTKPDEVPDELVAGITMLVGHLYENREAVVVDPGVVHVEVPMGVQALWSPYRIFHAA